MIVLLGFLLRIKSFNELNLMIKNNEFNKLFQRGLKLPKIDTIRDTLKVIDIKGLKQINQCIVKKERFRQALNPRTIKIRYLEYIKYWNSTV